jgi:hypothetical protein
MWEFRKYQNTKKQNGNIHTTVSRKSLHAIEFKG